MSINRLHCIFRLIWNALLLSSLFSGFAIGAERISGRVTDPQAKIVAGAVVRLSQSEASTSYQSNTSQRMCSSRYSCS